MAFREDECRIRKGKAPENFAVLRHIALNLLKNETSYKGSINTKRLKAAWNRVPKENNSIPLIFLKFDIWLTVAATSHAFTLPGYGPGLHILSICCKIMKYLIMNHPFYKPQGDLIHMQTFLTLIRYV